MEKTEKAKKIKKTIRNLIVFILLIGLTFYLIFKDQNVLEILNIAVSVKKRYILVAIIAMCLYLLGETINITRILKELGEKSTFLRNIRYTLIGFFFSSITPAASGGQPMEIYYMHKRKDSCGKFDTSITSTFNKFSDSNNYIGSIKYNTSF